MGAAMRLDAVNTTATIVIAASAASFAFFQWRVARAQSRQTEVQLLRGLREDWRNLSSDWKVAMMAGRGPGDYYVNLPWDEQLRFLALVRRVPGYQWFPDAGTIDIPQSIEDAVAALNDQDAVHEVRRYETSIREVMDFLARLGARIVRGDLDVALVYDAFGPSITNSAGAIRNLFVEYRYEILVPGYLELVLALIDLLWAHQLRADYAFDWEVNQIALHKRTTGSGRRNRIRVRHLARRHGTRRLAVRLEYLLTFAEAPRGRVRRFLVYLGGHLPAWVKRTRQPHPASADESTPESSGGQ